MFRDILFPFAMPFWLGFYVIYRFYNPLPYCDIPLLKSSGTSVLYGIWRILIPTKKELEGESEGGLDYEPIYVLNNTGCSKGTKYKGKKNDKSMISPATSSDDRF
jgi:hypothetical protein